MKPESDRLNQLLARLVDETIEADELAELESLLDGHPEAQDHYFRYLGLHSDLQSSQHTAITTPASSTSRRSFGRIAAAAAIILLVLPMLVWQPDQRFATIVDYSGPVSWSDAEGNQIAVGLKVGAGTLEGAGGESWVEVVFADGTEAQLSGIGQLKLEKREGQKLLHLAGGSLSIDAQPQPAGKPLRVFTPSAEAEVLGTQFNVLANAYSTRLNVNEGLVKVKRLSDGSTEQVKPDHEITASLEAETDFVAKRRGQSAIAWQSDLGRGHRVGSGTLTAHETVRAQTHLWRGDAKLGEKLEKPVLLHTITFHPSAARQPRIKIQDGQSLLLKGRTNQDGQVHVGYSANLWNGGLYGKYKASRNVTAPEFEIEIPLSDMKRTKSVFGEHPNGRELIHIWIQSVRKDIGLEIESVELLP
jgi:ferric-dicitrate binding protein FerR (iron transport regulator)